MTCEVRLVAVLVSCEARCADYEFKHSAHVAVKVGDREGAVLDGGHDAVYFILHARLHKVVACLDSVHGAFLVAPVSHDYALEAPLVTKYGGQEIVALLGKDPVDLVVRAHDRPRVGFADSDLESLEVKFTQSPDVHTGIIGHTVNFLVVGCEVLYAHSHTVVLDAAYIGSGHFSGKERVFGEIFEITAAERVAVEVLARSQEHVGAVFLHFFAHCFGKLLD